MEEQSINITQLQLYNEIWKLSVAGVAKKYNIRYADLLLNCKEWDIPVPPSGYWTKLSYGKPVTQTPLPESAITEIKLTSSDTPKRSKRTKKGSEQIEIMTEKPIVSNQSEEPPHDELPIISEDEQSTYQIVTGKYNTYNRQKLYEEVWAKPVVQVAYSMEFLMWPFIKYADPYKYLSHLVVTGQS